MSLQISSEVSKPAGVQKKSLIERIGTGIVYVAVVVGALWLGRWTTMLLAAVLAYLVSREIYDLARIDGKQPERIFSPFAAALIPVLSTFLGLRGALLGIAFILIAALGWYVLTQRSRFIDATITIVGAIYPGLMLSAFVLLRDSIAGVWPVLVIVLSVWVADSFAYLVGSMFGRHKMAPKVSPKKSWEGFFAGVIGSVLVWQLMTIIPNLEVGVVFATIGGIVAAIAGITGDLVESRLKREVGVKDSGTSLPGHGGFFDRMDSLLLVLPVSALVFYFFGVL